MRRIVATLLALGLVLAPATAIGHDVLEETSPGDGAQLDRVPTSITLTFSNPPLAVGTQVLVRGPGGDMTSGTPTIVDRTVTQVVAPTAPAGSYTVSYRVTSEDGHPISGTFTFFATTGLDGSTAAATTAPDAGALPVNNRGQDASDSQFVPVMLSLVGTLLLFAVGGFVAWRARERT